MPLLPLTRAQLDDMRCGMEHNGRPCNHAQGEPLYLHGRCHPKAATRTIYHHGMLRIECAKCDALVATIEVAVR